MINFFCQWHACIRYWYNCKSFDIPELLLFSNMGIQLNTGVKKLRYDQSFIRQSQILIGHTIPSLPNWEKIFVWLWFLLIILTGNFCFKLDYFSAIPLNSHILKRHCRVLIRIRMFCWVSELNFDSFQCLSWCSICFNYICITCICMDLLGP